MSGETLSRLAADGELHFLRLSFEAGDGAALLEAVRVCAVNDLPLPAWAARAFVERVDRVFRFETGSWDDAFGRPYRKGIRLADARRRWRQREVVYERVRELVEREGSSIGDPLFERVGKEIGLAKSVVNELYYETLNASWPEYERRFLPRKS